MDLGELRPSKIIAVHLNYRSRAEQRGRIPSYPSYFLKPPSSSSIDREDVVRPAGCELLVPEGEIALVIGQRAHRVDRASAVGRIGWVTAAIDFGVYDLRKADRGSNLLSKGQDGFTPLGPRLVPAAELDLDDLRIRTWVNGAVVQEGRSSELLFSFAELVADLSRFITLEVGDVILTGTPAGARPLDPGDDVEVGIDGVGRIRRTVVDGVEPLAPYGAMPAVDDDVRAEAFGGPPPTRPRLSAAAVNALRSVSTATLTVQLRKRGIANTFMGGLRPTRPDLRLVGYAHTLRYVPLREDVAAAQTGELNAQKRAVESIGAEEVLVIEARGETGAGTIGDILAMRALQRGAAGIVTDGGLRDSPAVSSLDIPTYFRAPHAATLGLLHLPLESGRPVACGGVLVMPGDVLVGDAEGVMVLPAALAEEVALNALEQEAVESFAFERVAAGESIRGLYPIGPERREEYAAWRAARRDGNTLTEVHEELT